MFYSQVSAAVIRRWPSFIAALLTMLLSERFAAMEKESAQAPRSAQADALREQIRKDMEKKK